MKYRYIINNNYLALDNKVYLYDLYYKRALDIVNETKVSVVALKIEVNKLHLYNNIPLICNKTTDDIPIFALKPVVCVKIDGVWKERPDLLPTDKKTDINRLVVDELYHEGYMKEYSTTFRKIET